jgi:hypothetical protein
MSYSAMLSTPLLAFGFLLSANTELPAIDSPVEKPAFFHSFDSATNPSGAHTLDPRKVERPSSSEDAVLFFVFDQAQNRFLPVAESVSPGGKMERFRETFTSRTQTQRQPDIEMSFNMPVLVPDDRITCHLKIIEPDPNIDYAMIVKRLDLAPPDLE